MLPSGASLLAAAALNADGDPQREIALLTDKGIFIGDLAADGKSITVAAKPLAGVVAPGNAIAAGDVNGDGIDDLAVAGSGVLQVFKGIPVLP